jgi:hypothetical protein
VGNFANDDHALMTGFLIGALQRAGIPAYPTMDDAGNYIPTVRLRLDVGHPKPVDLEIEVKPVAYEP